VQDSRVVEVGRSSGAEQHLLGVYDDRTARRSPNGSGAGMSEIPKWIQIVAPSTLIPALAFYFGWVCTNAIVSYFGVSPAILDLTPQDYALQTADVLFIPVGAGITAALVAAWVHSLIIRLLRAHPHRYARVPSMLMAVGIGLFLLGATAAWRGLPFATPFLFSQLSPGLGIGLLAYGRYLRRYRLALESRMRASPRERARNGHLLSIMLVIMMVVLSIFWAASDYATALGTGRAETMAGQLRTMPAAVLYAKYRLHIEAPGVVEDDLGDPGSAYRYRYRGLRLVFATAVSYVVVPVVWKRETGVAIVLPKTEYAHLQFSTAGVP
jgi:hypothetical protein